MAAKVAAKEMKGYQRLECKLSPQTASSSYGVLFACVSVARSH